MTASRVFHALGDPVRLEMLQRVAARQPCSIATVSQGLGISRQGARKHLQVLVNARLVALQPKGREAQVRLETAALEPARAFLARLERQWDRRLEALRAYVERT